MLPSETGATQGEEDEQAHDSISRAKSFCSETAMMVARKMTITCEATAKRNVFLREAAEGGILERGAEVLQADEVPRRGADGHVADGEPERRG